MVRDTFATRGEGDEGVGLKKSTRLVRSTKYSGNIYSTLRSTLTSCLMVGKKISDYRTIVPPRKVFFSGGTYPRLMVEKRNRTFFLCHTAHKNSDFSHFPTYIRTTYLCTYHTTRCTIHTLCHTAHKRFINTCRVNPLPCHVLIRPLFTDRLHRCRRCGSLCLLYIRRAS